MDRRKLVDRASGTLNALMVGGLLALPLYAGDKTGEQRYGEIGEISPDTQFAEVIGDTREAVCTNVAALTEEDGKYFVAVNTDRA